MSDRPDNDEPSAREHAAEQFSILSTRAHVGAAGFAQSQALEAIISAGREQVTLAHGLREVVMATQDQIREIAVRSDAGLADVQTTALRDIVTAGQAQIQAADDLRRLIQTALEAVRETPIEDISVTVLTAVGAAVQRQARGLEALVAMALSEVTDAAQITRLERVNEDTVRQGETIERERTERELVYLEQLQHQALARIRHLEAAGVTHAAQIEQLEADTAHAQRQVETLEAAEGRDLAQIARLETAERSVQERANALRAAAVMHRERLVMLQRRQNESPQDTADA